MKKAAPIVIIVLVLVAVAAVVMAKRKPAATSSTTLPSSQTSSTNQPVSANSVSIKDQMFSPESITVKKGSTVTWTNQDGTAHTVTADTGSGPDSGTLANGKSYSFTFSSAGTFAYHCNFHSDMKGTVIVTE